MKLDLPRAIALLATGAACIWLARSPQSPSPGASAGTVGKLAGLQISYRDAGEQGSTVPAKILADSIHQLQSLDGLVAQLDVEVDVFGEKSLASGLYSQSGQGVPRARWDLNFAPAESGLTVTQVFDGRFYYRKTGFGEDKTLEYIDLSQIPALAEPKVLSVAGPAGWFGVGGIPTMLKQLQGSFDFTLVDIQESIVGDHKMVLQTIRGTWKQNALKALLRGQVDPAWLAPEIQWDRLPVQMPHAVEITFGSDGYLDSFPYQIVFLQSDGPGPAVQYRDFIALKLHQVARKTEFDAGTFTVTADDTEPVDKTGEYLARVKMFLFQPIQ